jgi:ribosome-associated toxin RatA of RatAB toxin-antitoxin module
MRNVHREAVVSWTPAQMFSLVNDIEAYPRFLPWCRSARVLQRDATQIRAMLVVGKSGFEKAFTTLNRLQQDRSVDMRLVEGPFRHLQGLWRFEPLDVDRCRVSLSLWFELSGALMALTLGPVFNQAANTLVDAFVKRAHEVYGAP